MFWHMKIIAKLYPWYFRTPKHAPGIVWLQFLYAKTHPSIVWLLAVTPASLITYCVQLTVKASLKSPLDRIIPPRQIA